MVVLGVPGVLVVASSTYVKLYITFIFNNIVCSVLRIEVKTKWFVFIVAVVQCIIAVNLIYCALGLVETLTKLF